MTSHYLAYFTVERSAAVNPSGRPSRWLQAVCGALVREQDHTISPTCPTCLAWLEQEAAADAETVANLHTEGRS